MQVLPLLGTGALLVAAGYTAFTATQQDTTTIPLIGTQVGDTTTDQSARQISLVPNARDNAFYTAITDRPLFQESRRPIAPQIEEAEEPEAEAPVPTAPTVLPQAPPPNVRLLGVLAGGARTAALLSISGDDPQWQNIGSDVAGWTLDQIAADHIVLTEQERAHRVELYQR